VKGKNMKKLIITLALITAVAAQVACAAPDPREVHERVIKHLKTVRDALVPPLAVQFVETFPPIAIPREKILHLAQVEQEPFEVAVPPPGQPGAPPIDPSGVTDFALTTTQRVLDNLFPRAGGGPRRPVIVGGDVKSIPPLEEDLSVMLRILEKAAGAKEGPATAAGIEILSFNRPGSPRAFYLDGYGAMFLLNVGYPLMAPPKKEEQSQTNDVNSEWEKAREEVYGRRGGDFRLHAQGGEAFDAQRVDNLKSQLIDDLGNAKNIRHLKSDDYVTVVVMGGGPKAMVVRREVARGAGGRGGGGGGGGFGASGSGFGGVGGGVAYAGGGAVEMSSSSSEAGGQGTMTLRAKKSDIDAFAKGKLDAQEFRKKVAVQIY
jgi:hypothetical protein